MKRAYKKGSIALFLPREFFNSLVAVLSAYVEADGTNKYGIYASKLKKKFMTHGRTFFHDGEKNMSLYLYEQEAAMLIKLFAIYSCTTLKNDTDFYLQVEKQKKGDASE